MRAYLFPSGVLSPYRLLGLAVLCAVVLAQLAGLVMLARSQVEKAQMRAIYERSARWEAADCFERSTRSERAACVAPTKASGEEGLVKARYAPLQ